MDARSRWPGALTDLQAAGLACVVCGRSSFGSLHRAAVPVANSQGGSQVFACAGRCERIAAARAWADDDDQDQDQLLRVEEVARMLSLSRSKVFEMIGAGELPVLRFGRSVRVSRRHLSRWIDGRTRAA
jgi:excisionase family DNA binding protein